MKPLPKLPKAPYPHSNLGTHLKAPKGGEFVTEYHRPPKAKS